LYQFVFRLSVLQVVFFELNSFVTKHLCKSIAFDGFMLNLICCATDSLCAFFCVSIHYVTKPSSSGFVHCVSLTLAWLAVRVDFTITGVLGEWSRLLWTVHLSCSASRRVYLSEVTYISFLFGHPLTPSPPPILSRSSFCI
jgi:hypothetical protein